MDTPVLDAIHAAAKRFIEDIAPEELHYLDVFWPIIRDSLGAPLGSATWAGVATGLGIGEPGLSQSKEFLSLVALGRLIVRVQAEPDRPSSTRIGILLDEVADENRIPEYLVRQMRAHLVPYVDETDFFEMRPQPGGRLWHVHFNGVPKLYSDADVESAMNDSSIEAVLDARTWVLSIRISGQQVDARPVALSLRELVFGRLVFERFPGFVSRNEFRKEWGARRGLEAYDMSDEHINVIVHRLRQRVGGDIEKPILAERREGYRLNVARCLVIQSSQQVGR